MSVRVCQLVTAESAPGVWVVRSLDGMGGALLRPRDADAACYLWAVLGEGAPGLLRRVTALSPTPDVQGGVHITAHVDMIE